MGCIVTVWCTQGTWTATDHEIVGKSVGKSVGESVGKNVGESVGEELARTQGENRDLRARFAVTQTAIRAHKAEVKARLVGRGAAGPPPTPSTLGLRPADHGRGSGPTHLLAHICVLNTSAVVFNTKLHGHLLI